VLGLPIPVHLSADIDGDDNFSREHVGVDGFMSAWQTARGGLWRAISWVLKSA
jgi:hypothetical protein